ncbi:hypothetical protein [Cohnella sp. WQ 127256]|uniref:hypothetical protein n=1 Tax=Cohnella sp. WQ 127256 TaxID=2938790 RepID=UPI002119172C|nr:hypothetical protein [Cohnella sp. WQ 127256]
MWYWILWVILAAWTFFDAKKRSNNVIGWPIGTLLIGPIVLPVYFAKRYLKVNEVREGGTAWNVLKNFALYWTLTMLVVGVAGAIGAGGVISDAANDAEQAGAVIGAGIGLTMIFIMWLVVVIVALILGFFLKKSSIVEKGPTGKLAESQPITA